LIKMLWKGFSEIQLQWTWEGQRFPQVRGNRMVICPQCESKSRWLEPIKEKAEEKI
jgi:hypothetical protein